VILDFSLVIGLDSSAAHSIAKMNSNMHRRFNVAGTVFVTPPDDFSCEGTLSKALQKHPCGDSGNRELDTRLNESLASIGHSLHQRNRVCNNLDDALIFAEDVLIILQDPSLLIRDRTIIQPTGWLSAEDERRLGAQQLANLFPASDEISNGIQILFSHFVREEYKANDIIWEEGADSDCAKLLVRGELIAYTQGGANTSTATERVPTGNIGESPESLEAFHRCVQ
jgi:SulP family sulfate permease